MNDIQRSYDALAEAYAAHFFRELEGKPADRALVDLVAGEVRGQGRVVDLGCGPGHVARYLSERGVACTGIDLSPGTIEVARRLSPHVAFQQGSMLALDVADGALAGIVAFYAIVNLTRDEVAVALREMHRVLRPGAPLLLAFHLGEEERHVEELLGVEVKLDFRFFPRAFVEGALEASGFTTEVWLERKAVGAEHPSERGYVVARKPLTV
jgi:SAM-dependent methyltransferase